MESSAHYFNFTFDRSALLQQLQARSDQFTADRRYRVRLLLSANGDATIDISEMQVERFSGHIKLSQERTSSADLFLRHKTTRREFYDRKYAEARAEGFDEAIFMNEKGELTEGAISNLFIEQGGRLLTPPLTCGVLPGVFRRHLLETNRIAEERILTVRDLKTADGIFIGNSVRGLRRVTVSIHSEKFCDLSEVCSAS
jgi:para-aminobenzoate synthetase/4-amino-4-deoxychorismate lyase